IAELLQERLDLGPLRGLLLFQRGLPTVRAGGSVRRSGVVRPVGGPWLVRPLRCAAEVAIEKLGRLGAVNIHIDVLRRLNFKAGLASILHFAGLWILAARHELAYAAVLSVV